MNSAEKILAGAVRLFKNQGPGFTVDELAKETGTSKKTIYVHFNGKEGVIRTIADRTFDDIHGRQRAIAADSSRSCSDRLRALLTLRPTAEPRIDYRWIRYLARDFPELHAHILGRVADGWEPTVAVIEEGISNGEFRAVNVDVLKETLLATMRAVMSDTFLIEHGLSYEEAFGNVMDIILNGIGATR
ncbi:MAG: hypothetical protein CVV47_10710 [Spirochaetae bacterium HGW-Spirochaetae-3]|nr:MAG: hypothetical protein CVV47_10710 [Spirochaetae bacterium HGW-Spirochaetae-3]